MVAPRTATSDTSLHNPAGYLPLGTAGPVRFSVACTAEPWTLDVDALVVSVGNGLGSLGRSFRKAVPRADWESIPYGRMTPDMPFLMALTRGRVQAVIATTPHPDGSDAEPTSAAVVGASVAAVALADRSGLTSVALPLLATGVLGLPLEEVAEQVVPAVAAAVGAASVQLRHVVFVAPNDDTAGACVKAWRAADADGRGGVSSADLDDGRPAIRPSPLHPTEAVTYSDDSLAGGLSSDLVDATRGIPLARDRLNVVPYVSMLATVIADRSTPMPLSIGVFGEWGSGKSYFMGLLREQVRILAASDNPTYTKEIVQIGFNAWHYSDTNLWASLGAEIFDQLAGPRGEVLEPKRRDQLHAELTERLEQRKELRATADLAAREAERLRAAIDEEVANRDIHASDLLVAVRKSVVLKKQLDRALSGLGIADEAEQGRLLAAELHGTTDEVGAVRRALTGRRGLFYGAVAVALLVAPALLAAFLPTWSVRLASTGLLASLAAVVSGLIDLTRRARNGLASLRCLADELRKAGRDGALVAVADEVDRLRTAETRRQVTETEYDAVVSRVAQLDSELAELAPGRQLYRFLAQRADSESYRGNLGLISTVRRDFEQLVRLMDEWRTEATAEEAAHEDKAIRQKKSGTQDLGAEDRTAIDRVVLYIDDLDRCSPQQVVDVLQAVHLLLALELFVVVVGVDPRWLIRSLCHRYDELLDTGDACGRGTPDDYLEKILNIPLVLPTMGKGSLRGVLEGMVDDDGKRGPVVPERETEPDRPRTGVEVFATKGSSSDPSRVPEITVQPGSQVDRDGSGRSPAPPRPITVRELDLLGALEGLVDSPRVAKRILNLYRMIRSTRDLSAASTFLGSDDSPGDYQAVVVLLGLLTVHGALSAAVFDAPPARGRGGLAHRPADQLLVEFVADLRPVEDRGLWRNGIVGDLDPDLVEPWDRLAQGVDDVTRLVTLTDLACLQNWLPVVRRFSFALAVPPARQAATPRRSSPPASGR